MRRPAALWFAARGGRIRSSGGRCRSRTTSRAKKRRRERSERSPATTLTEISDAGAALARGLWQNPYFSAEEPWTRHPHSFFPFSQFGPRAPFSFAPLFLILALRISFPALGLEPIGSFGSSAVSATPRFEGSHMASTTPHDQPQWEFSCDMEVDFGSEEHASIVYAALAVDKELQPDKVKRGMTVSDGKLSVHFEATEARFLRASFSAFVDVLTLATKTIEQFGQEMKL
ncbi:hypothetical protein V8G54_037953 (chloroplast) [Vigna mungo]|uniref:Uncharacterized protein n=1 Tax=Vigna mungo TaxID=3915 RepID=A0AAQ3R954_VIGMU